MLRSKISFVDSSRCRTLDEFSGRIVRETSIESFQDLPCKDSHVELVEKLIKDSVSGLTDFEIRDLLKERFGVIIPLSTVSARRNDVNVKYADIISGFVVINVNNETRISPYSNKSCLVWKWKK